MEAFDFSANYVLEDDRVLLRPLASGDIDHLIHFSIEQPEIWRYSMVPASSPERMQQYFKSALEARENKKEYAFIVYDKRTQEYAGSTRFYDIQLENQSMQLGYTWYGKEFQGTGLNKHCKFLLLQFAFEEMGMVRVELRADNNNAKSIAAMKSIGCTAEGVLRQHAPTQYGGRRDTIVLSILRDEWEGGGKEKLRMKLI